MQPIADFCARGGSVLGLRTSNHAFSYPEDPSDLRQSIVQDFLVNAAR